MPSLPPNLVARRTVGRLAAVAAGLLLGAGPGLAHAAQLAELYRQALDYDATLAGTRAALVAAQQAEPIARAALKPQVVGQGQYTVQQAHTQQRFGPLNTTADGRTTAYQLTLSLTQTLYDPVKFLQVDRAVDQADAAELQIDAAVQNLSVRLAEAYFNTLAARDGTRALEAESRALERQTAYAQRRFDVGLATVTDLREAQARADLTRAGLLSSQAGIASGTRSLTELTGANPPTDTLPTLREALPLIGPNPASPDAWVRVAQAESPTVLAARKNLELARTDRAIARARHLPTLSAGVLASDSENESDTSLQASRGVGVQVNAYVPLYLGGALVAGEQSAAATAVQRETELDGALRGAERQVRDAYAQVGTNIARVQAYKKALASARLAVDASRVGVQVGVRTSVDLLNAEREFYSTRRDYDRARYDYLLSVLRLKAAAGRLDGQAIAQVDELLDGTPGADELELPPPAADQNGRVAGRRGPVPGMPLNPAARRTGGVEGAVRRARGGDAGAGLAPADAGVGGLGAGATPVLAAPGPAAPPPGPSDAPRSPATSPPPLSPVVPTLPGS